MSFKIVPNQYRKHPNVEIQLPKRGTSLSAGYDFCIPISITIPPHTSTPLIFTDICVELKNNQCLQIIPRSSIGIKKNLILKNTLGLIDADYYGNPSNYGNIGFAFYNYGDKEITIEVGERIMQGIVLEYHTFEDEVNANNNRVGGIGSTN